MSYARKYTNIRYIYTKNSGASKARNHGMSIANGKYVLFVDSDDTVTPTYVEDLLFTAEVEECDYVLSGMICESDNNKMLLPKYEGYIKQEQHMFADFIYAEEKSTLLYSPCVGIYRTAIIKSNHILFPESLTYGEDRVFNWQYISHCKKIAFIKKANYF